MELLALLREEVEEEIVLLVVVVPLAPWGRLFLLTLLYLIMPPLFLLAHPMVAVIQVPQLMLEVM